MKKSIDTHMFAARQVLVLAGDTPELDATIAAALPIPQYVARKVSEIDEACKILQRNKVEVAVLQTAGDQTSGIVERLRAIDPDLEVVVLAQREQLVAVAAASSDRPWFVLGCPFSASELVQTVECARERRYFRRAEERGKRAEARIKALVSAAPTAIASMDVEGIVYDWNPSACRIFALSELQALGKNFWTLTGLKSPPQMREQTAVKPFRLETAVRRADGQEISIEMWLAPIPTGETTLWCAIVEDRTEAKRLAFKLQQSQKLEAVGQLAEGLAHEINTPCQYMGDLLQFVATTFEDLQALAGAYGEVRQHADLPALVGPELWERVQAAEQLADLDFVRQEVPKAIAGMNKGIEKISTIVGAMKDFARIDQSQASLFDLNKALQNILIVAQNATQNVALVETEFAALPEIWGQRGDLNRVFLSLVMNAAEAIGESAHAGAKQGGRIRVVTKLSGAHVVVSIQDNGGGIPPHVRERVFEPFFTTKDVGRGPGQGLSVAWAVVVDGHGGSLTFDTEMGVGTTFHVSLPVDRCSIAPLGRS